MHCNVFEKVNFKHRRTKSQVNYCAGWKGNGDKKREYEVEEERGTLEKKNKDFILVKCCDPL